MKGTENWGNLRIGGRLQAIKVQRFGELLTLGKGTENWGLHMANY